MPVARYVFAANPSPSTGYQPVQGSASAVDLFTFPNDVLDTPGGADTTVYVENEKTFPTIAAGGTTSFEPTAPFAISAEGAASTDDQFNRAPDGVTTYRSIRSYPAKGATGAQLAEQLDPRGRHQEHGRQELRLPGHRPAPHERHARPHQGPGVGVRSGSTRPWPRPSPTVTVEGTGFASVQPNAAGDQHQPAALDLTSGTLRVTSGAGSERRLERHAGQRARHRSSTPAGRTRWSRPG